MWKFLLINDGMEGINEALRTSQNNLYWESNDWEDGFSQESCAPEEGATEMSDATPGGRFLRLREILLRPHSLGRKGEKLLEAYRKRPAPTEKELHERKERSARGPSFGSLFHLRRIEACLEAKFILDKLRSTRGFEVRFGDWEAAPLRKEEKGEWLHSPFLVRRSPRKTYSRSRWHQEYSWCEQTSRYLCRGYWASKNFVNPALAPGKQNVIKVLRGQWRADGDNVIRTLGWLPVVPPCEGLQPFEKVYRLSYLRTFFHSKDGVPRNTGHWQVTFNVSLKNAWEEVGPEGFLYGEHGVEEIGFAPCDSFREVEVIPENREKKEYQVPLPATATKVVRMNQEKDEDEEEEEWW